MRAVIAELLEQIAEQSSAIKLDENLEESGLTHQGLENRLELLDAPFRVSGMIRQLGLLVRFDFDCGWSPPWGWGIRVSHRPSRNPTATPMRCALAFRPKQKTVLPWRKNHKHMLGDGRHILLRNRSCVVDIGRCMLKLVAVTLASQGPDQPRRVEHDPDHVLAPVERVRW